MNSSQRGNIRYCFYGSKFILSIGATPLVEEIKIKKLVKRREISGGGRWKRSEPPEGSLNISFFFFQKPLRKLEEKSKKMSII